LRLCGLLGLIGLLFAGFVCLTCFSPPNRYCFGSESWGC
jgi:hypothetical protein